MSRCNADELLVCSWCIIASPPHGKVHIVFDGLGVHLMFPIHVSSSLVLGMLHVFIYSRKCLLACAPYSSHSSSCHALVMYLYLQSVMTRQHKIQKSPNLP